MLLNRLKSQLGKLLRVEVVVTLRIAKKSMPGLVVTVDQSGYHVWVQRRFHRVLSLVTNLHFFVLGLVKNAEHVLVRLFESKFFGNFVQV